MSSKNNNLEIQCILNHSTASLFVKFSSHQRAHHDESPFFPATHGSPIHDGFKKHAIFSGSWVKKYSRVFALKRLRVYARPTFDELHVYSAGTCRAYKLHAVRAWHFRNKVTPNHQNTLTPVKIVFSARRSSICSQAKLHMYLKPPKHFDTC